MSNLFPTRTVFSALGCLMQNPMLLEDNKIKLTRDDFYSKGQPLFHVMVFAAINNLYDKGMTAIQPVDIDEYLSEYKTNYKVFADNDGLQWCYQAIEYSEVDNYPYYAEKIKKFSLLRELDEEGFSLTGIYDVSNDPDDDDEEAQAYFDSLSVDDIIQYVEKKVNGIASTYQVGYDRVSSKAGDNGIELLERFKESPMYGFPTTGEMQNTIFRGILPKTSLLRSALTNVGKSRMAIAEATDLAIGKWYDYQKNTWESKGKKQKVLFISTEMEEDELQPTMWSYVSGIKEEDIRDGKLTPDEEEAVRQSILHLQECDLYIEYVPKFDPQTINAIIKEYAIRHDVDVVFFDYIHLSFEIMMEISSKTKGMTMREDMMLTIFASGLEELAREYNFHLRTSTQMNGNEADGSTQMLDQSLLRGAKAMADKMQYGIIMAKPSEKELGLVQPIVEDSQVKQFGGHQIQPNLVYHIYKNRKSKYKGKLWFYVDYDTMRQTELFMTDFSNNLIKVPKTDLLSLQEEN